MIGGILAGWETVVGIEQASLPMWHLPTVV